MKTNKMILLLLIAFTCCAFSGEPVILNSKSFLFSKTYQYSSVWEEQEKIMRIPEKEESNLNPLDFKTWKPWNRYFGNNANRITLGEHKIGRVRYLLTFIQADQDTDATLKLKVDYLVRILVNGKVTHPFLNMANTPKNAGWELPVKLKKGWNPVMFKVGSGSMGFDISASIIAANGKISFNPYEDKTPPAVQTETSPVIEICSFPDGKKSMIALTFDDGSEDHFTHAAPMLEKRGFRGTFFLVTANMGKKKGKLTWDQIRQMSTRGHEMSNHSRTHDNMAKRWKENDLAAMTKEMFGAADEIEAETGKRPVTFCYAGNSCCIENNCWLRDSGIMPMRPRYFAGGKMTAEAAEKMINSIVSDQRYGVIMIHGIVPTGGGWAPFKNPDAFDRMLDTMAKAKDTLYVGTYEDTESYTLRAKNTELKPVKQKNNVLTYRLSTSYNGVVRAGKITVLLHNPVLWDFKVNGMEAKPVHIEKDVAFFNLRSGDLLTFIEKNKSGK